MQHLSEDREFRYIVCWFQEFSELQREDFMPILLEYLTKNSLQNGNGGVHINGLVNALDNASINNKPMSLFQCRMKLFREWSAKWPLDYKRKLQERITEIDPKVGEKIVNEIGSGSSSSGLSNGLSVEENGGVESAAANVTANVNDEIVNAAVAIVNATEEAIITDNLAAMLNNETSVDDDVDNNRIVDLTDNNNDDAHVIEEPAGQVQNHQQHVSMQQTSQVELQQLVIEAQSVLNNSSAEVPLVA